MSSKIIEQQLKRVQAADLSNFDSKSNTYIIKQRADIKIEEDKGYIIFIKDSAFTNNVVINNWNNGSFPKIRYLKVDINKRMNNMIKVVGIGYDPETKQDLDKYWSGWICIDNIEIIEKL